MRRESNAGRVDAERMSYHILKDWKTKAGFRAVVVKTPMGHNCGYVGIPKSHVLYGKNYNEHIPALKPLLKKALEGTIGKRGIIPVLFRDASKACMDFVFDVHGSVSFSRTTPTFPVASNLHWIGFDCAHDGDTPEICDLNYCVKECESLARQIKQVKK